jgi:translation elongation factor EF-Tu-like GTPase
MINVNGINHFTINEVVDAVQEYLRDTSRGDFRPDEIPGVVASALRASSDNSKRESAILNQVRAVKYPQY